MFSQPGHWGWRLASLGHGRVSEVVAEHEDFNRVDVIGELLALSSVGASVRSQTYLCRRRPSFKVAGGHSGKLGSGKRSCSRPLSRGVPPHRALTARFRPERSLDLPVIDIAASRSPNRIVARASGIARYLRPVHELPRQIKHERFEVALGARPTWSAPVSFVAPVRHPWLAPHSPVPISVTRARLRRTVVASTFCCPAA